jgi:hypothetical protein
MEDAERERDRELLEQLKSPDVPETPNIPGIIVDNASGWGANAPRENRPIAGYVVDDHEEDHGADGGLGSLRAAMAMGGGEGTSGRTGSHLRSGWIIGTRHRKLWKGWSA